jgi:hypothetical protein
MLRIMLAWDSALVRYFTVFHLLTYVEWAGALLMSACLQALQVQHSPERQRQRMRTCRMLLNSAVMLLTPDLLSKLPPNCPLLMVLQVSSPQTRLPLFLLAKGPTLTCQSLQNGPLACSDAEFCCFSPCVDCAACRFLFSVFLALPPLFLHIVLDVVLVYCGSPCVHSSSVDMSASIFGDCAEVWISHYPLFVLPLVVVLQMASHCSRTSILFSAASCSVILLGPEVSDGICRIHYVVSAHTL